MKQFRMQITQDRTQFLQLQ